MVLRRRVRRRAAASPGRSPDALPAPEVSGSTVTFAEAASGADLVVSVNRTGVEMSVVIPDAASAASSYEFNLATSGLTARQDRVRHDRPHRRRRRPGRFDHPGDHVRLQPVRRADPIPPREGELRSSLTGMATRTLVITPDAGYFSDPATKFPVTIDPSASLAPSLDTQVVQSAPTTNYDGSTGLSTGWNAIGLVTRSFLRFPTATYLHRNVTAASLNIYQDWSNVGSCSTTQLAVRDAGDLPVGATWNTQPTIGSTNIGTANTTGDPTNCPASVGYKSVSATSLVQDWAANDTLGSQTLAIRSGEPGTTNGKGFQSAQGANQPSLSVTYYTTPVTPSSLSPAANATVDTLSPSLKATAGVGDTGATLTTTFTVKDSTSTTIATGTTTSAGGSSNAVSWPVTTGKLRPGESYSWTAKTCTSAGANCSASTTSRSFTVNPALGAGDQPYFTYNSFPISDRSGLKVNVASGNLEYAEQRPDRGWHRPFLLGEPDVQLEVAGQHGHGPEVVRLDHDQRNTSSPTRTAASPIGVRLEPCR